MVKEIINKKVELGRLCGDMNKKCYKVYIGFFLSCLNLARYKITITMFNFQPFKFVFMHKA